MAPIDIAHRNFGRKVMGLDPDEVMSFLRQVADEMDGLIREKNRLKDELRQKEIQVLEFKERDEVLKNTITTATKMSEKVKADAEREANLIINDAQQKSEMIVRDSRDSLKRIFQDITELKKVRMQFEGNLKALLQSHLTMLDQGNKIMPNPALDQAAVTIKEERDTHLADENLSIEQNVSQAIERASRNFEI